MSKSAFARVMAWMIGLSYGVFLGKHAELSAWAVFLSSALFYVGFRVVLVRLGAMQP
jgi:hypothetical protein